MRVVIGASVISLILLPAGAAIAKPPAGTPGATISSSPGRPDFAGSGRPSFGAPSNGIGSSASSNANSSSGGANNTPSFSSNSNAGGQGLSHAASGAQPTLQVVNDAFAEQEISLIREFFTTRAHAKKPEANAAATPYRRGQKLVDASVAEPLPADLLAQLPNRPGLTYVRIGNDVLLLAGPNDVVVDVIPGAIAEE